MGLEFDGVNGIIKNTTSDGDITIKGNDSGSEVTAMSFDMSAAGIATLTAGLKLTGTTPTLTIGDAGEEDTKIVFDGNAQDFHIGLDDSVDDLIIGKGSTLGTTPALTINEDLQTTIANHFNPPSSFRNLIINGNMSIAQRAATATGVANDANEGYNSLDRFGLYYYGNEGGVATMSRDTTVPSDTSYGVQRKSLKVDVTTADTSLGATGIIALKQTVEAQNIHHSGWDYTSSSSNITLSFWARTVKAGT